MATIKLKNGSGAPLASDLVQGEPALDLTNKRLYTEDSLGAVIEVGTNPSSLTIGGTALTATATELNTLDGITATTAELNIMDGVTATFAELNTLDGITSTTAELNKLDGFTGSTTDLNEVVGWATGDIALADNQKATFGTGSDLQIYHNGTHSYISESGAGDLKLYGANIEIGNTAGFKNIFAASGGGTFLYNNNALKLSTTSTGIDVTGTVTATDSGTKHVTISNTSLGNLASPKFTDVLFKGYNNSDKARIRGVDETGNAFGGRLLFETSDAFSNDQSTLKTRLGVDRNGDVSFYEDTGTTAKFFWDASAESLGIGTSSPTTTLDVSGTATISEGSSGATAPSDSNTLIVENNGNAGAVILTPDGSSGQLRFGDVTDGSSAFVQYNSTDNLMTVGTSRASGELRFTTGNVGERVRIDANGNVGIGTSSPDAVLTVSTSSSSDVLKLTSSVSTTPLKLLFEKSASEQGIIEYNRNGDLELYNTDLDGGVLISGSASADPDLYVAHSGNVGIGTSSPSRLLHVRDTSSQTVAIFDGGLNGAGEIGFRANGTSGDTYVTIGAVANDMVLSAGASERMRIDSSGNLLVGKTTTGFGTAGTEVQADGLVRITRDGASALQINRKTSDGSIVTFNKDSSSVGSIGVNSSNAYFASSEFGIKPTSVGLVSTNTSGVAQDGAEDLGGSSFRWRDLYLSGGAYLGGTAAANKLDDYEEGTFTPELADAASGGNTGTATTIEGRYTKVGRQIVIIVKVEDVDTTGMTGANNMFIRGLPFVAGSGTTGQSQGSLRVDRVDLIADCCGIVVSTTPSTAYLTLRQTVDNSADVQIKVQDFTSGSADIFATLTYFV